MKTLTSLTLTNLKQNRSRTIMTIIGVALSVALILACVGFVTSVNYSERQDAVIRFGDYHIMYKEIPGDKISIVENHALFDVQFYSEPVGCVTTEYGFQDCYGLSPYSVDDYTPIQADELERDSDHEYNVFLKYKNPAKASFADDRLKGDLHQAGISDPTAIKNNMVAYIDGDVPETTSILSFWLAFGFMGAMSIIAAFVIRNSFTISITERIRQFGMLASIGARPKQIRRMVYEEGLFIGLIAIPLGILLGCAATLIVVAIVNHLIGFTEATDMLFFIPFEMFVIVALVGLFIIFLSAASPAIVASRVSPIAALRNTQDIKVKAKKLRTSKLTQKLFGIGGVIAAKNLKRSRSKYRTTVISIVLSIAVFIGISSFMMYGHKVIDIFNEDTGANAMVMASNEKIYDDVIEHFNIKEYAKYYEYGIKSNDEDYYTGPHIKSISRDEFERYAKKAGISSNDYEHMALLQDTHKGADYGGNTTMHRVTEYKVGDEITFRAASYDYDEDAVHKCDPDNLFADKPVSEYNEEELEIVEKCKNGELDGTGDYVERVSKEQTIKITHIVDFNPMGVMWAELDGKGVLYISEDNPVAKNLNDFAQQNDYLAIGDKGLGEDIQNYLENPETIKKFKSDDNKASYAMVINMEEALKSVRNTILLFEIIIYGFIIVAALIGITNIFNTITTNVALRAKEFAVLKSVGMTEKEFNHMIYLESAMYTVRSLLIGLPIGFLMSYGVYKLFDESALELGWLIPWHSVAICVIVVAALVALIMHYSTRKIKKQNIIETIRKESF